jgi:spermidine/putrescine transport system permease protein
VGNPLDGRDRRTGDSITFSFDDYVITTFVSGPGSSTLPLFIFGQVKRGVTPETNAVATVILVFSVGTLLVGQLLLMWQGRRTGRHGDCGMASIVTDN